MTMTRRVFIWSTIAAPAAAALGLAENRTDLPGFIASLLWDIHTARNSNRPDDYSFFILDAGRTYVQAAADQDDPTITMEAVSLPSIGKILTPAKARRFTELGFNPPGVRSSNHWQDVCIGSQADLLGAAKRMSTVLIEIFHVQDPRTVTAVLCLPGAQPATRVAPRSR